MAKKTTAKAAPKAKSKKPAPKPAPKKAAKPAKPVKKAAPAAKSAKGKPSAPKKPAIKSKATAKPSPAKPSAKPATAKPTAAKQAPAKPAPKKATPPPVKTPEKRIPDKKANVSVTKSSAKPDSMSNTAVNKSAKPKSKGTTEPQRNFAPYEMKKGEEYMNDQQKEHFKRILLNWRDELMQEVDRTVHHMQDEAANPPDPADRATLEEEFSIELRTRDRERRLIKKIDSTIELIANDEYGYCDSCGVEIGIRRLEARPTANKCIDCKTLDEIKEKQLGSP